jgi:aminoglycoside phosphotransferase
MTKDTILKIDETLRLHINYKGVSSDGKYLLVMDKLAAGYSGSKGEKVSALLDDYFKEVGVKNLNEALQRLHRLEVTPCCKQEA